MIRRLAFAEGRSVHCYVHQSFALELGISAIILAMTLLGFDAMLPCPTLPGAAAAAATSKSATGQPGLKEP